MKNVYVSLSQFCENNDLPRRLLLDAGFRVTENKTGRRIRAEELPELLREADAVLAAVEPYGAGLLAGLPRLRCISRCGAGTDAIDLKAAAKFGKTVLATTDEVAGPVAEMTVAMLLALAKNFSLHGADFREGLWKKRVGVLLSEWTAGIVGFGRIGRRVAGLLAPFGAKCLVFDPQIRGDVPSGVSSVPRLEDLLAASDAVTLHAGRPPSGGPLMGKAEFQAMRRGSFFVNTARGHLVDESALLTALTSGHLAGAALDVFESEPYGGPLAALPQVLATPHVATLTRASRIAMELKAARNIVDFFKCP